MSFSARGIQILHLLSNSSDPVPAQELANELQLSKRTIFRELKDMESELKSFGVRLDTKSKKGISLIGGIKNIDRLHSELAKMDFDDPRNIEKRRNRLMLELLRQEAPQKIFYYSSQLKVSDATIHSDLDVVEKWFEESKVTLVRKSGLGIYLDYREEDYRKACMRYIYQDAENPLDVLNELVEDSIVENIREALRELPNHRVSRMTENSFIEFIIYLSIMTKRILLGRQNNESKNIELTEENIKDYQFVLELSSILSNKLHLQYNTSEIADLFIYIRGAKVQYLNSNEDVLESEPIITNMIYEMINQYDSSIAHLLKQDQVLIQGLITHIKPTIIRLQNDIQIQNPFQDKIKTMYPEIYKKSQKAVTVLEQRIKVKVPEEELGLLAIHFGGAEVRLKRLYKSSKKVEIGVICPGGIGISSLISSRLSNIFYNQAIVSTFSYDDLLSNKLKTTDIIISTFKFETPELDYIHVDPMLPQDDIDTISNAISVVSNRDAIYEDQFETKLLSKVVEIGQIAYEIESILDNFELVTIEDTLDIDALMMVIDEKLGKANEHYIYEDLKKREAISAQVIPEFEFVFLHAKTKGVDASKFIVIKPNAPYFKERYFNKSKVVVVMLIPEDDPRTTLAISRISVALFEDSVFLDDVKNGETQQIRLSTERILKEYLKEKMLNL